MTATTQSSTVKSGLADMPHVQTSGDLRRIVANAMLAVVRGEMETSRLEALAKGCDSISASIATEVKVARAQEELRSRMAAGLGEIKRLGELCISDGAAQLPK